MSIGPSILSMSPEQLTAYVDQRRAARALARTVADTKRRGKAKKKSVATIAKELGISKAEVLALIEREKE